MTARADTSSGTVYHLAPKSIESKGTEKTGNPAMPKAAKEETEAATEPEGEPESEEHHQSGAAPPGEGGNQPPRGGGGSGKGKPTKAPGGPDIKPGTSNSPRQSVSTPIEPSTPEGNDGGGSSPVLPILIAVAILAAGSIGVVLYRERSSHRPFPDR